MKMTPERAAEILDPTHREHYDSIEPVEEACRMGMEALRSPLMAFIRNEVPFRMEMIMGLDESVMTPELIEEAVNSLYDNNGLMFDYDAIDDFLGDIVNRFVEGKG